MSSAFKIKNQLATVGGIVLMLMLILAITLSVLLKFFNISITKELSFFISRILFWILLSIICFYTYRVEKQPLLIWKDKPYNFEKYLGSIFAIFAIIFTGIILISFSLSSIGLKNNTDKIKEFASIFKANKPLLIFTAITAGVVEELLFRGYLIPRLILLVKNSYVAVIISAILFGAMHFSYNSITQLINTIFIGLVFGFYYWKYRNIKILILCHILWDLSSLFLLIKKYG